MEVVDPFDGSVGCSSALQRHLWCEEYRRRHGSWPVEDAPLGHRPDGRPHPVRIPSLRRQRYLEAVQTLVAWTEIPYRVRRRAGNNPATLANRGHNLPKRLAYHQARITTTTSRPHTHLCHSPRRQQPRRQPLHQRSMGERPDCYCLRHESERVGAQPEEQGCNQESTERDSYPLRHPPVQGVDRAPLSGTGNCEATEGWQPGW